MTSDPKDAGWRPSTVFLVRGALLSAAVGSVIGWLALLGGEGIDLENLAWSALVGILIFLLSCFFVSCLSLHLDRLGSPLRAASLSVLFALAGILSWLIVNLLSAALHGDRVGITGGHLVWALKLAGGPAVVVGFAFYGYERLRLRLEESVSRLKEAEFATRELELARDLQLRLQPPGELAGPGFRVAARNLAARWVAGDFYDVFRLGDGTLGLAVADVAGKGLGASLIMASVKARLPLVAAGRSVVEALGELNRVLADELGRREFVALCCTRFDPSSGEVTLANAGLPEPFLIRPDGAPEAIAAAGACLPLGVRKGTRYAETRLVLRPGDRLLLFTDGLAEARTLAGEPLGYEALAALLPSAPLPPAAWLDALFAAVAEQTRPEREDDWTAVLLERPPLPGAP